MGREVKPVNEHLLLITFWVWLLELVVATLNAILIVRAYQPCFGELRAHQIGMTTRILYLFVFAYFMLYFAKSYTTPDLLYAGIFWMLLILVFEWGGSALMRRPIHEILVGWHVNKGVC